MTFPEETQAKRLQKILKGGDSMVKIMEQYLDSKVGPGDCSPQYMERMKEGAEE